MAQQPRVTVLDREPAVGQTLEIDRRRWNVTDHSTYVNADGLEVDEWECARADGRETAYLLREQDRQVRWFFTRPVPLSAITLPDGKAFGGVAASLTQPPGALTFRTRPYTFGDVTDGTYEEEPGEPVRKITWDYWDAPHKLNLAIERWADGRLDAYHGEAIDPVSIAVRDVGTGAGMSRGNLVLTITVVGFSVFLVATLVSSAVETGLTAIVSLTLLIAFLASLRWVGPLAWGSPVAALLLGILFARFPPLTTLTGMLGLFAAALALAAWASRRRIAAKRMWFTTAMAIGAPTYVAGLTTYYRFAPTPRSIGQYFLAVGPTPIVMVVAFAVAWAVTRMDPGQ